MSSFLNSLLAQQGCNVDGTVSGRNPLTAIVDRLFDTNAAAMMNAQTAGADAGGGFSFYDAPPPMGMGAVAMPSMEAVWAQQQQQGMGMGMGMGMGAPPQQAQHMMMMMHMQQQQHLVMMQHQHQHAAMAAQHRHQLLQQQQQQQQQEQQLQQQFEQQQQEQQKSTIERAIEATMQGDEPLSVERLEDIWSSFGLEAEQQRELLGAAGSAKQASYPEGASAAGYRDAWNKIAARLEEPPPEVYAFERTNPYLLQQHAAAVAAVADGTTASASASASAVAADEHTADSLLERGMGLFQAGAVSEAVLAFEAAAQLQPDCDTAWRMLGRCHAECDEDKRAIPCLQRAVECDPYSLPGLMALGTSYVNELDSVRALETLRAWVQHNPEFSGFQAKVDAYSDGTLMDEVTQLMLAAAEHSPASADVHVLLGVLYNISLDYDGAVEHLRRALTLQGQQGPDLASAATAAAAATAGGVGDVSAVGEAGSDYATCNKLGATLANAGRAAEAVPLYAAALSRRPTFARGWLNLGISFANLSQYPEAAKAYLQALHLNPRARHIWGYLRVVLTCMERLDLVEVCGSGAGAGAGAGAGGAGLEGERANISRLAQALGVDLISEPVVGPAAAGEAVPAT